MKKTVLLLTAAIVTGALLSSCSIFPPDETTGSSPYNDSVASEISRVLASSDGPSYMAMPIDFNPKDYGRIIPNMVSYKEDMWEKEKDSFLYSFTTLDGEIICGPLFDFVSYSENAGAYIVRRTEEGVSKYGFLSNNGAVFTGLIFDGAAEAQNIDDDELCFFGTNYENGKLYVSPVDIDLEVLKATPVTIDENELSLNAASAQLSVLYMNDKSVMMINRSEFYYKTYLVDISSGKLLYANKNMGLKTCKIFGNVVVEQDIHGKGITVYGMDGSVLVDDPDAYSGRLSNESYMVSREGTINVYDYDWNIVNSMPVTTDTEVMTSFGTIAVVSSTDTNVYDKDLKLINTLDYPVTGGTYLRDWHGFGKGDFFYDSISDTREIINLTTGAKLPKEDGFYYEFKHGYIIADNESNGNDPVKKYRIYDHEFKEIMSGEGTADILADEITGDLYLITNKDGVYTVYSLPSLDRKFSLKADCYNLNPVSGRFYGYSKQHFIFVDGNGKDILCYEIDYTKVNEV